MGTEGLGTPGSANLGPSSTSAADGHFDFGFVTACAGFTGVGVIVRGFVLIPTERR
jgi:hypothetical protein